MTTMIKTQPSSLTVIVHGGGNNHMSTSAAFTWTYQMCTHSFSEQGDWRVAYPLIVRRSLWLILDVAVHRLPGHRQAVEMGHLQRAHLLHLWSRPLLHALVWQQNGDREKVTVCVSVWGFLVWGSWCTGEAGPCGLTCFSTTMSSAQFRKAVVPHSSNMFLRLATSMSAGNETTFVESHALRKAHGWKGVLLENKLLPAQHYCSHREIWSWHRSKLLKNL